MTLWQGNIYWKEGNYDNARTYAQQALDMLSRVIDKHYSTSANSEERNNSLNQPPTAELQSRMN